MAAYKAFDDVSNGDSPEIDQTAQMISDYLDSHPEAADTLDGIVNWWLMRQRQAQTRDTVKQALEKLVKQGIVVAVDVGGGKTIYRSAPGKRQGHLH